jgi:hypothetical protein
MEKLSSEVIGWLLFGLMVSLFLSGLGYGVFLDAQQTRDCSHASAQELCPNRSPSDCQALTEAACHVTRGAR